MFERTEFAANCSKKIASAVKKEENFSLIDVSYKHSDFSLWQSTERTGRTSTAQINEIHWSLQHQSPIFPNGDTKTISKPEESSPLLFSKLKQTLIVWFRKNYSCKMWVIKRVLEWIINFFGIQRNVDFKLLSFVASKEIFHFMIFANAILKGISAWRVRLKGHY